MDKENERGSPRTPNVVEEESLTPEQRAQISLRFRAAKALLARKRPRLSTPFTPKDSNKIDTKHSTCPPKSERAPLKDLDINISCQSASRVSCVSNDKYVTPSSTCYSTDMFCDTSTTRDRNGQSKVESPYTPIRTTGLRFERFGSGQCSSVSSLLDEDFDDSILLEIDSLCEGSSVKKLEREVDFKEDGTQKSEIAEDSFDIKTASHMILESSPGVQDDVMHNQTEDVHVSQPKELLVMPENYSKYMETLNEDQMEAASTDASTPLMVVAGPGSGKDA